MKGGEISSVIESLSRTVTEAGKVPKLFEDIDKLSRECSNNLNGVTDCYGAVVFLSSPAQGSEVSDKGTWNYTIRGSSGISSPSSIDVTNDNNAVEIYQLPFQRAVDAEIISISKRDNTTKLPTTMKNIIYTSSSQDALDKSKIKDYLALCINALGALFTVTLIGIVYHMPTFVAGERELGMSSLIGT
jgi:ATP-binding cassette subfamily A (ABC1) protein 3